MLAAADEAKESLTILEAELESTKAQMADLKKVLNFSYLKAPNKVVLNENQIKFLSCSLNSSMS